MTSAENLTGFINALTDFFKGIQDGSLAGLGTDSLSGLGTGSAGGETPEA